MRGDVPLEQDAVVRESGIVFHIAVRGLAQGLDLVRKTKNPIEVLRIPG